MDKPWRRGWRGVDLDATLAFYDHWRGDEHIGAPIEPMVQLVKGWLRDGWDVRIFTARVCDPTTSGHNTNLINKWSLANVGRQLPVTNRKDWLMVDMWDDRCVPVEANTGRPLIVPVTRMP